MNGEEEGRYILVTRKTRLQELVERFNTWPQARFYLEHNDSDPGDYVAEHDHYQAQVIQARRTLADFGRLQVLERSLLPSYQFGEADTVVVIGQDGLVANTLKYLSGQPVIGVNPDPDRWDGVLLPFVAEELADVLKRLLQSSAQMRAVTFAEAKTNDGQRLRAVNDLFVGPASHTSARYVIEIDGCREEQSSSGVIISTGFGSTGWLQSILAGAKGIYGARDHELVGGYAWDEARLHYAVREPFPSLTSRTEMVFGRIERHEQLVIESRMPERGVIFSDGMEQDFIAFNAGTVASIGIASVEGCLVVPK